MNKKHEQGVCPFCGSDSLEYVTSEIEGNVIGFPWECEECGSVGEELYLLTFTEHINLVDERK